MSTAAGHTLESSGIGELIAALSRRGYLVVGPTVAGQAIVYGELRSAAELPAGWGDEQEAGHYRLRRREDEALFGYAVGPHSWKRYQLPPDALLWRARRAEDGTLEPLEPERDPRPLALIGVRSCELHAMGIMDRVRLGGAHADPGERERRRQMFIVAVQCTVAGGTCFCTSMGTGPEARDGYDLALTEVIEDGRHYFVMQAGSERGAELMAELDTAPASEAEVGAGAAARSAAAAGMGRELDSADIRELLLGNLESPRWAEVAERCLSCGNCTMVCPTCFCTSVEDTTDLAGETVERHERWDSCFTVDHSYIHGGPVRATTSSRYRQWMTHKLATWFDQFGSSGCVGCGRCITWCPVGIDITEQARLMREDQIAADADA